jgi:hypothetical protein
LESDAEAAGGGREAWRPLATGDRLALASEDDDEEAVMPLDPPEGDRDGDSLWMSRLRNDGLRLEADRPRGDQRAT